MASSKKLKPIISPFLLDPHMDIEEFITEELEPIQEECLELERNLEHLVSHLRKQERLGISKHLKGGPYARGVSLRGNMELDLVVFSGRFSKQDDLLKHMTRIMDDMHQQLRTLESRADGTLVIETRFDVGFLLKMKNCDSGRWNKVHLYPAFDILANGGKSWVLKKQERAAHHPSLVSMYSELGEEYTPDLRRLIRLVLHWRATSFKEPSDGKTRLPGSLLLERLCLHCWRQAGAPQHIDVKKAFKSVLESLRELRAWNYTDSPHFGFFPHNADKSKRPLIVDPCSPWHNLCDDVTSWQLVVDTALECLRKPLLNSLESVRQWSVEAE